MSEGAIGVKLYGAEAQGGADDGQRCVYLALEDLTAGHAVSVMLAPDRAKRLATCLGEVVAWCGGSGITAPKTDLAPGHAEGHADRRRLELRAVRRSRAGGSSGGR